MDDPQNSIYAYDNGIETNLSNLQVTVKCLYLLCI